MTKEEYVLLYEKWVSGNCTDAERRLLESYSDDFSLDDAEWDTNIMGDEMDTADQMYSNLYDQIHQRPRNRFSNIYKYAAAAVLFMILGAGLYMFLNYSEKQTLVKNVVANNTGITAGEKKGVLTLQDGSEIILDRSTNGVVSIQGNVVITESKTGKEIYNSYKVTDDKSQQNYNSLKIPRGGEYEIRLPDNTKVWLNSESTLKFPAVFSGPDRRVELTGEAYFEVSENKLTPFKVFVNGTEIEVLGTHFNVNAYRKSKVTTSLLEGSVKLKNNGNEILLKPGQQGVSSTDGKIQVNTVNVKDAIAWKNGYFIYHDDSIYKIMADAARWYDVEVEYRGDMRGKGFYGKIDRYDNITELLKNIELTGTVYFKIEGRRVIVMSR